MKTERDDNVTPRCGGHRQYNIITIIIVIIVCTRCVLYDYSVSRAATNRSSNYIAAFFTRDRTIIGVDILFTRFEKTSRTITHVAGYNNNNNSIIFTGIRRVAAVAASGVAGDYGKTASIVDDCSRGLARRI